MPENITGTLTSSDHNFTHMLKITSIRYEYYALPTLDYLEPLGSTNYLWIVAFSPALLRALFHSETISIHYSTTVESSPVAAHI